MWEVFAWLTERGYGDGDRLMRRYSIEQIEVLFYLSRKQHFRRLEQEIDMQSRAFADRLGQEFEKAFS